MEAPLGGLAGCLQLANQQPPLSERKWKTISWSGFLPTDETDHGLFSPIEEHVFLGSACAMLQFPIFYGQG